MARHRPKGNTIHDPAGLLKQMGETRKALLDRKFHVQPFGEAYKEMDKVHQAIIALARYMTGDPAYYSIGGSSPPSGMLNGVAVRRE